MGRNYRDSTGANNPNYKTGLKTKGNPEASIHNAWMNMKGRCFRDTHPKYSRYGGRGITVCDEWLDIKTFYDWAKSSGWFKGASIDRIDNDGNYCPENCRWVSMSENSRKKSTTKLSMDQANDIRLRLFNGENEYDLAKEYGVVHGTIWFIKNNFIHVPDMQSTLMKKEIKKRNDIPKTTRNFS